MDQNKNEGLPQEQVKKPFEKLTVALQSSTSAITDLNGQEYELRRPLRGEEAYLFLVALNRMDKKLTEVKSRFAGRPHVEIFFRYGNYNYENNYLRLRVGSSGFQNHTSIAKAIQNFCLCKPAGNITSIKLKEQLDERDKIELKFYEEDMNRIKRAFEGFIEEEKNYLKTHPEIEKINQEQYDTYLYRSPKQATELDYAVYSKVVSPQEYGIDEPGFVVGIASKLDPAVVIKNLEYEPFYTKKEREILDQLNQFSIEIMKNGDRERFVGAKAYQKLDNLIAQDKCIYVDYGYEKNKDDFESRFLRVQFKELEFVKNVQIGSLSLGNQASVADTLRYLVQPETPKQKEFLDQFDELERLRDRYTSVEYLRTKRRIVPNRPDIIYGRKPSKSAKNEVLAVYYKERADYEKAVNPISHMIRAMENDGFGKQKTINVLKAGGIENAREYVRQEWMDTKKRKR